MEWKTERKSKSEKLPVLGYLDKPPEQAQHEEKRERPERQ
jgi:hypothetical protein